MSHPKETKEKKLPTVEWFAECGNSNSNNGLSEALTEQSFGYDSEAVIRNVPCHDGKPRDFFRIPGDFVTKMKRAKKGSDVLKFRFWKRNGPNATAFPADFVEQGSAQRTAGFQSAADRLRAIKAAQAAKDADTPPF